MEQQAIVTAVRDGKATVRVLRESACAGCHKMGKGGVPCRECRLFDSDPGLETEAVNEVGAAVGDRVTISSPTGRILFFAAMTFFVPALLAFVTASVLETLLCTTLYTLLGFCAALALSFFLLRLLLEPYAKRASEPRIIRSGSGCDHI